VLVIRRITQYFIQEIETKQIKWTTNSMQLMKLVCLKYKSICYMFCNQITGENTIQFNNSSNLDHSNCSQNHIFTKQLQIDITHRLFSINQYHCFINLTYIFLQQKAIKLPLVDSLASMINYIFYTLAQHQFSRSIRQNACLHICFMTSIIPHFISEYNHINLTINSTS